MKSVTAAAVGAAIALLVAAPALAGDPGDYVFKGNVELGAPGFWDYLTYDAPHKRLYASHITKVDVIDAATGKVAGEVGPFHDSHGVAVVDRLGKGYADSGADGVLKVFDMASLAIVKEIKVSEDADGVVYDPHADRVLVVAGDSKNVTLVDPNTDAVTKVVPLPGKPEFLVVDGRGAAFINLVDVAAIAQVDIASGEVRATWPLANCNGPHGLAYDPRTDRLFSGCDSARLAVVNARTGENLANLPIGPRSDSVGVDPARGLAFSANGDGTLSVVTERGDDFQVIRTIPTFFGGRNMTVDPETGRLFVSHGHMAIVSPLTDPLNLKFAWSGLDVAIFEPAD